MDNCSYACGEVTVGGIHKILKLFKNPSINFKGEFALEKCFELSLLKLSTSFESINQRELPLKDFINAASSLLP